MWTYHQESGQLEQDDKPIAHGYSGFSFGKNNPAMQDEPNLGPIPRGTYTIELITDGDGNACDYEGKKKPVMRLVPDASNDMFGRAGFLIHGDSISHPGTASHGCVIEAHNVRQLIADGLDQDNQLTVV